MFITRFTYLKRKRRTVILVYFLLTQICYRKKQIRTIFDTVLQKIVVRQKQREMSYIW